MTFPVFRPLVISATFILCSVFAGNCRAEIDLPCLIDYKNKVVVQDDTICFSVIPLQTCSPWCHPLETEETRVGFHCPRPGESSSDKEIDLLLTVSVPVRCEVTLPVAVSADTAS